MLNYLAQTVALKGVRISGQQLAAILLVLGFALLVVYTVGMNGNPVLHEAFHDVRHAAGFPCH